MQPVPAAAGRASSTAGSTRRPSGSSTACCGSTSGRLRWCCATARRRWSLSLVLLVGHGLPVLRDAQGLPAQRGHRPDLRLHRGGAGHLVRRHGASTSRRLADDRRGRTRTSTAFMSERRRGRRRRARPTPGRMFMRLKPRDRAQADAPTQVIAGAAAEAGAACPASASSCRTRRPSASAASSPRASTSSRCRAPTPTSCTASAPQLEAEAARAAGPAGRDQRPADHEPAGQRRDRPRPGLGARASRAQQIEDALYNAYGTRQVSTIYAPNNQYRVILELEPRVPARPARPVAALRALVERAAGAARARWPS